MRSTRDGADEPQPATASSRGRSTTTGRTRDVGVLFVLDRLDAEITALELRARR
jgi:hypothetical protein